ncbi:ribonuclease H-like domain-containing protein [Roridomyces roridus]|uniref:DNA polymerase delta catalytic subunit n=1 Tax=Roridomyces roridus TaxID=1738132 RepID=A0AAD7FUB2_9AGAR|nr:ribonuclease H-like domain-containing protein [Roridomyces roridus]
MGFPTRGTASNLKRTRAFASNEDRRVKARPLTSTESFDGSLQYIPNGLVLQLVTAFVHRHEPAVALLFGITEEGVRVTVHVNLVDLPLRLWKLTQMPVDKDVNLLGHYEIPAMSWVKLPADKYDPVRVRHTVSHNLCQTEVTIRHDDIMFHSTEWIWATPPTLRTLSFSIQTSFRREPQHPQPADQPILHIVSIIESKINGNASTLRSLLPYSIHTGISHTYRVLFTTKRCARIPGVDIRFYTDESDMLAAWRSFLLASDPDLVTGFNIGIFDLNHLILRAEKLKVPDFACLGRIIGARAKAVEVGPGQPRRFCDAPVLAGRLQLDVKQYILEELVSESSTTTASITLNEACRRYLRPGPDDYGQVLDNATIRDLQTRTDEDYAQLVLHCLKDTYLTLRLLHRLKCIEKAARAARHIRSIHLPFDQFLRHGRSC